MKSFHQFSEESKSAFHLSPILIKERPALIRKPYAERGYSAPEAPPALGAPVDLGLWAGFLPAVSLYFCSARALTQTQILSNGILELNSHISYIIEM